MKKNILFVFGLFSFLLNAHFLSAQPNGGWLMIKIFNRGGELNFSRQDTTGKRVFEKTDSLNVISMKCYASFNHQAYRKCNGFAYWRFFYGLRLEMDEETDYKLILTSCTSKEKMIILFNDISHRGNKINIDFKPGKFRIDGTKIAYDILDITPADWESVRIKRTSRWYQRRLELKSDKNRND